MDLNEINKSIGKSKIAKIIGFIFLIAGVLVFIATLSTYLNWKLKEENYNKQYVYSSYGNLYYEMNNTKIYVSKIYNTDLEIIKLEIPNHKTAIMYCSKDNPSECIYFDLNNSVDRGMLNPFMQFLVSLFCFAAGSFLVTDITKKDKKNIENSLLSNIYLFYVFFFMVGVGMFTWQVYNSINYFKLKPSNDVTTATIYSEIYNIGKENDLYKPVSYYYVNNQKYIYVSDAYISGNLEENLGKTFELYYNKENPIEVSKKENPINYFILIAGIVFIVFTFPFVFFKGKMEKRLNNNLSINKNKEWKI